MYCIDDELDNLMDISIEIESNKVMKADFIDPWTVTLRVRNDPDRGQNWSEQVRGTQSRTRAGVEQRH